MARLRYNGLVAELGAALASGDTTITFAAPLAHSGGTAVPTITGSDYIPLALLDVNGILREIINLTSYTSGATTGTILRAQESTTASDFIVGASAINAPTTSDFTTSSTGDASWTTPTLLNSWVNFGSGYSTAGFRKDGQGYVHLKGTIKGGATTTIAFVLPAGYRPVEIKLLPTGTSGSSIGRIDITTAGEVKVFGVSGPTVAMGLDGITFLAEA